jgi:hypothetical protein
MSISTVVTRGYGLFGSVNLLPVWGYYVDRAVPLCVAASQIVSAGCEMSQVVTAGSSAASIALAGEAHSQTVLAGADEAQITIAGESASQIGCC